MNLAHGSNLEQTSIKSKQPFFKLLHCSMPVRGGQKIKKLDLELACKLFLFSYFHWFQKYKDELWGPLGSASPGMAIFGQKYGKNTKEMAIIWDRISFWP